MYVYVQIIITNNNMNKIILMNINLYTYTHIYTIYTNRKMYRQTGVLIYALCILYIYIYTCDVYN